ncbi:MAG: hypothetical protein HPY79_10220 [Bacteroidales bacterium]|nr:hypothetical protein [Bacteroidales bacterium]
MINKLFYNQNSLNFWYFLVVGLWGFIITSIINHHPLVINFSFSPVFLKDITLNTYASIVLIYLIILASAFIMMSISKEFADHVGLLLPSIVFVLLINILTSTFLDFTAVLIIPFFLLIIKIIISLYDKQKAFEEIIYIGFLNALISLINIDFTIILFLSFFSIIVMRPFYIKEYILLLLSYFFPFIFMDAIMFFISNQHVFSLINRNSEIQHFNYAQFLSSIYPLMILLILSFFTVSKFINRKIGLKKIRTRRFFLWLHISLVIVWLFLFSLSLPSLYYIIVVFIALSLSIVLVSLEIKRHAVLLLLALIILNFLIIVIM